MRVLRLAILVSAIVLPAEAQPVTIINPDAPGIELIGSQSPDFQASLEAITGPGVMSALGAWVPFTVVIKNNSSQPIVAYHIFWSMGRGRTGLGIGSLSFTDPAGYLKPGQAVAYLPQYELTRSGTAELPSKLLQRGMTTRLSALAKQGAISISVDSAIFASGQFVGRDQEENFAHDVAGFTAWRAVDTQVQSELAAGKSSDEIAAELSQIARQPIEAASRETHDWNAQVRIDQARHLLRTYQRSGEQALHDLVEQQLQQPEIVVHR
jgi:hypothetical protein